MKNLSFGIIFEFMKKGGHLPSFLIVFIRDDSRRCRVRRRNDLRHGRDDRRRCGLRRDDRRVHWG